MSAYSATDLQAIRAALASGVLEVAYDNRRVTYRSVAELRSLEAQMAREIETPRRRQTPGVMTSSGY